MQKRMPLEAGILTTKLCRPRISGALVPRSRLVLDPALPVKPDIIAIPSDCDLELATDLSDQAISLAPVEIVVEIGRDGTMYTHALDATRADQCVREALELRRELLRRILP